MVLDSSAVVAVILAEQAAQQLLARMKGASTVGLGAPTLVETLIVLASRLRGDPIPLLSELLKVLTIEVIPFTDEHSNIAFGAWLKYGKGRHPSALNYGDCLAYATAKIANQPLLYIGADFARTDIVSA